jgi:hypothetical protein
MKLLSNRLIKFTRFMVKVTRKSRIPLFSCRKSKRTYTQRQHITVLGLMKYLRTDYRGVIEQLALMPEIKQAIGLTRSPHFTTIHKFLQRFSRYRFDRLLDQTVNLFETGPCTLAIDWTGYSSVYSSEYYNVRIRRKPRRFINSSIAVDTDSLLIASHHSRRGPGNDCWFLFPLVRRASRRLDIRYVVGDKAYDSEVYHEFVHREIGARSVIPVKNHPTVNGYYRKKLSKRFPERIYHRRSLVETVFSMIKRRFGSFLQSRSLAQQNREVGLLCVVYNVYRYVTKRVCYICWMFSTEPLISSRLKSDKSSYYWTFKIS